MTAYTNNGQTDNEGGRPSDKESTNETKQANDKVRNKAKNESE